MARKRAVQTPGAAPAPARPDDRVSDEATCRRLRAELRLRREELAARRELLVRQAQRDRSFTPVEYESIFDLEPTPCLVLDANGFVHRSNRAAAQLLGLEHTRRRTTPLMVFVGESDRRTFLDHMRRCRRSSETVRTDVTVRARHEGEIPVELRSHALERASGERELYHTAIIDLRERRRAERERVLARKQRLRLEHERRSIHAASAAKDRFLAILSHELRTPLTPVLLATSSWKDDPTLPPSLRDALAMMHRNVSLEARLIDDLLDLTRVTNGKMTLQPAVVDPAALITEVIASLGPEAEEARLRIDLDLAAQRHVCGDPLRFRQIVANLLRNAIRFTPAGGCVTVETRDVDEHRLALAVTDTGIGFDAADATNIFEPFAQSEGGAGRGGLGLGLAITKGLVEAHGGTVQAFSDGPDRGARFVVTLPSTRATAASSDDVAPPPTPAPSAELHILLVEDHVDTSAALAYVLEQEGYTVRCAHSVAQALETAAAEDVDVLVSDLGLPDGSGLDLMRAIRARKSMRGIALTGYGRREDLADTRAAGFDRHLTKPVDPPTLIAAIESLRDDAA